MKWEAPALASVSSREPAPIQKPRATERTFGIRSEMTRSPESSSERTYFCTPALSRPGASAAWPGDYRLPDAERIPVGVSQDRESQARALLRLDHRCADPLEPLDLRLPIVAAEVQVHWIARGPRLLPPLKEEPRPAAARRPRDVEAAELPLVDTCVTELLHEALLGLLLGPAESLCPERAELPRLRARERDVADVAMLRLRRCLDAEPVSFRVPHHGPRL